MAERYDNDRERRWRSQSGDRWNEGGQDWSDQEEDQNRPWDRTRQWRRGAEGRSEDEWRQGNRDPGRDYPRGYNRDFERNSDFDRDRQSGERYGQNYGRNWDQRSSGENYDRDYGREERSGRDFGQPYREDQGYHAERGDRGDWATRMRGDDKWGAAFGGDRGNYGQPGDRGQGVNRDEQIYNRDWYNWDYEGGGDYEDDVDRGQQYGDTRDVARWRNYGDSDRQGFQRERGQDRERGQNRDRGQDRDRGQNWWQSGDRGDWQYRQQNQGQDWGQNQGDWERGGRESGGWGSGGLGSGRQSEQWGGQYRTAGMNSDYGQSGDYERRDYRDRDRGRDQDLNFRRGDVGFDNEGAFYQDLDEPINNRYGWEVPGRYTGMGPQNYQRSDQRILEDVSERFYNHGRIDASDIEIDVQGGEVTLKGSVPSREMKRLAEDVAVVITGVRDVNNEIKVKPRERDQSRGPNLSNRGYDLGEDWDQPGYRDRNRDSGDWRTGRGRYESSGRYEDSERYASDMQRDQNRQDWATPRGESTMDNVDTGLGSTSGIQNRRDQLRQDMEVIDQQGKVIGRVKEMRDNDFLVDREMARDIFVPYTALDSVGAQAMLNVAADDVDTQGWDKPNIL